MGEEKLLDLTVLYVEDDDTTRDEVSLFLRRRVRTLLAAANGQEGLKRFCRERPDVVVTDIRMPVMDGLRMAREIRAQEKDALIIVTTAHSDASIMLDAIEIGVDQYVLKPVNVEKLAAAVEKCASLVELKRAEIRHREERERLVTELQEALSRVKQLTGLLPICASCKKIKSDDGYWQQIEVYIHDHSEAEFSHGLCPECSKRLYPEYFGNKG